jgi:hypothetical protein
VKRKKRKKKMKEKEKWYVKIVIGVPSADDVGLILAVEEDDLRAEVERVGELAVVLIQEVPRNRRSSRLKDL